MNKLSKYPYRKFSIEKMIDMMEWLDGNGITIEDYKLLKKTLKKFGHKHKTI